MSLNPVWAWLKVIELRMLVGRGTVTIGMRGFGR